MLLEFEGAAGCAEVYVNNQLVHREWMDSVTFRVPLTPYVHKGVNRIRVNLHGNALPNARWYKGCGLIRPVHLLEGPAAALDAQMIRTQTCPQPDGSWQLQAIIGFQSEPKEALLVQMRLFGPKGELIASAETPVSTNTRFDMQVRGVLPWSPQQPEMYLLTFALMDPHGKVLDTESLPIGFRSVLLDRERGFLLNGEECKLIGGCVHADNGLIGAMSLPGMEEMRARALKDCGFNAVRCAHEPPSQAFLDACDRIGLMLVDEFTDVWNIGKNPYDYHLHFREHWQEDMERWIRRDRNHPCVVMWSLGNEIPERSGIGDGYAWIRRLRAFAEGLDGTRPFTSALNNIMEKGSEMLEANTAKTNDQQDTFERKSAPFLEALDAAGYNYLHRRYSMDLARHPGRLIIGTESVIAEYPEVMQTVREETRVIGDFAWAAIDYLGESGIGHVRYSDRDGQGFFQPWPWRCANCGDLDILLGKTPRSYYRDAVLGRLQAPYIAVQHPALQGKDGTVSYWGWPERAPAWDYAGYEGQPVRVDVYSMGKNVALFLNGNMISEEPVRRFMATFTVPYAPGMLCARDEYGERTICTPGKAHHLELHTRNALSEWLVTAAICDRQGIPLLFDRRPISFEAEGCGLLAAGSADPASPESFGIGPARAYNGTVGCVLRASGPFRVKASAPELAGAVFEQQNN